MPTFTGNGVVDIHAMEVELAKAELEQKRVEEAAAQMQAETARARTAYQRLLLMTAQRQARITSEQTTSSLPLHPNAALMGALIAASATLSHSAQQSMRPPSPPTVRRLAHPVTPIQQGFSELVKRQRPSPDVLSSGASGTRDQSRPWTPMSSDSTESQWATTSDDSSEVTEPVLKRRVHRTKKLGGSHAAAKPKVALRRVWLCHAHGDKKSPITHRLGGFPAFYHPDLDELSAGDSVSMVPVPLPWESQQPEVRQWFTEVLMYRLYKLSGASDSANFKPPQENSRLSWEDEHTAAVDRGWTSFDPMDAPVINNWNITMPMPDRLYVELVKLHMHPTPLNYLRELVASQPALGKIIHHSAVWSDW
jgi:hypothetical protein